ncbi:ABC transporter ATP-binding protein [Microbacterium aerolatum]|uniref:ABC transporter ATP-binding protein n=1 Tax=Microbacterium aerolatum TaxID=153731 RepID=A0A511AGX8_9MICO|nr:dipeptide/oligopeptide/nickel ABC transporter ATP-binding protein [Microbacterium aerolatum]GEK87425.1 ABC transporter ATP-binding protein [Microbacterium aerolatum]GGB33454.1 ABC transporter ATP-binding protein [Microbacterium aerolatum]
MRLLTITDLSVTYARRSWRKPPFTALRDVSLDIREGESLGLVGESGSGKSTLGRAVLGLAPVSSGSITFAGEEIAHAHTRERRRLASDIQVVFQDPYSSLSPSLTIGETLAEPLRVRKVGRREADRRITEALSLVNLPPDAVDRLPRDFSGGQRQRIAIARALVLEPRLIICDEPVSALDLTTQSRVLDLFLEVQRRTGVAYLFISHDLSVVRVMSHRIAVMRQGRIVESGTAAEVTSAPKSAYTRKLLLAAPVADPALQKARRAAYLDSRVPQDTQRAPQDTQEEKA